MNMPQRLSDKNLFLFHSLEFRLKSITSIVMSIEHASAIMQYFTHPIIKHNLNSIVNFFNYKQLKHFYNFSDGSY